MLQLQLGKRPTTVSQPTVRAGFLPPQTCLGFSWSVGYSESHCNIVYFKICLCVKPLPHHFPFRVPVFLFFWSRQSAKVSSPNTFRFGLKRGGMLGTHVRGPVLLFYSCPILFHNLYIYFTFQGTKPNFFGLSSQRLMLLQTCFYSLRDLLCIVNLVPSPKRTGCFSPLNISSLTCAFLLFYQSLIPFCWRQ